MTDADRAFYEWFHETDRTYNNFSTEWLRQVFLAGWAAGQSEQVEVPHE